MEITKKKSAAALPRGWRQSVAKILSAKGFQLNLTKISNIKGGFVKDPVLTTHTLKAIAQVQKNHRSKQQKIKLLKKQVNK